MNPHRSFPDPVGSPPLEYYVRRLLDDTPEGHRSAAHLSSCITLFTSSADLPHPPQNFPALEWVISALLPRALPPREFSTWVHHLAPLTFEGLVVLRAVLHWECTRTDVPPLPHGQRLPLEAIGHIAATSHSFSEHLQRVARLATELNLRDTLTVLVSDGMTYADALNATEALGDS